MFNIGSSPVDDMGALMANLSHPIARSRAINSIAQKYGGVDKFAGYYSRLTGKDPQEVADQVRNSLLAAGDSTDAASIVGNNPTAAAPVAPPPASDPLAAQGPNFPTNPGLNANNVTPLQAEQRGYAEGGRVDRYPESDKMRIINDLPALLRAFGANVSVTPIGPGTDDENAQIAHEKKMPLGAFLANRVGTLRAERKQVDDQGNLNYNAQRAPRAPWPDPYEDVPMYAKGGIVQHFDDGGFAQGNLPPNWLDPLARQEQLSGLAGQAQGPAAAAPGSGGIVPPEAAPQTPDAAPAAPEQSNWDKWAPLLAAGLGIGASRNLNPLGALAEGGLEGLKYIQQQKKNALDQAHADYYRQETQAKGAETALKRYTLEQLRSFQKYLADEESGGPTPPSGPASAGGSPAGAAAGSAVPGGASAPDAIASAAQKTVQAAVPAVGPTGTGELPGSINGSAITVGGKPIFNIAKEWQMSQRAILSGVPQLEAIGKAKQQMLEKVLETGKLFDRNGNIVRVPGADMATLHAKLAEKGIIVPPGASQSDIDRLQATTEGAVAGGKKWGELAPEIALKTKEQQLTQEREIAVANQAPQDFTFTDASGKEYTTKVPSWLAKQLGQQNLAKAGITTAPPGAPPAAAPIQQPPAPTLPAPNVPAQSPASAAPAPAMQFPKPPGIGASETNPVSPPGAPTPGGVIGKQGLTPVAAADLAKFDKMSELTQEGANAAATDRNDVRLAVRALDAFPTGATSALRLAVGKYLLAAGVPQDAVDRTAGSVAAGETLDKALFRISSGAVRNMGAREPGSVMVMFQSRYPNLEMRPETNRLLLNVIDSEKQRAIDKNQALVSYRNAGGRLNGNDFEGWFQTNYPTKNYLDDAFLKSGFDPKNTKVMKTDAPSGTTVDFTGRKFKSQNGVWMLDE